MNTNYSLLARSTKIINNPSMPIGTLIEEIPADIGRAYEGYKRGGILEAAEKLRKDVFSAFVWLCGIPIFNKLGNQFCEKALKIPTTNIDFSNLKKGNDAIGDTARFLKDGIKKPELDYSELEKFAAKTNIDFSKVSTQALIKKISTAKKITSILAVILNCAMMGFIIPKFNQYLTKRSIEKKNTDKNIDMRNFVSFDEFQKSTKNNSAPLSFNGLKIPANTNDLTYAIENNNRFRLIVTDIPMIIGRMLTSRNKYEAIEFLIMDGTSIYAYNFVSGHVQKLLRGKSVPDTQATSIEILTKENNQKEFVQALEKIQKNPDIFKTYKDTPDKVLKNIFGNDTAVEIYKNETYGKYGKANRYIENDTIKNINKNIESFINHLKTRSYKDKVPLVVDGKLNTDFVNKIAKEVKRKNAAFLTIGLSVSILCLSVLIPKLTYAVTRLLTGKNEFVGIADYNDDKKNKTNKK